MKYSADAECEMVFCVLEVILWIFALWWNILPCGKMWNNFLTEIVKYLTSFDVKWNLPTFAKRIFHICGANISQRSYFICPQGKFRWKKHTFVYQDNVCFFQRNLPLRASEIAPLWNICSANVKYSLRECGQISFHIATEGLNISQFTKWIISHSACAEYFTKNLAQLHFWLIYKAAPWFICDFVV